MRRLHVLRRAVPLLLGVLSCLTAHADFAAAADRIRDSVVTVQVEKGMGTGFIVNAGGYVLTNQHVLGQATAATVRLANGDELPATVARVDDQRDLLLLKVDRTNLPAVVFASSAKLKQGSEVAALGAPFGLADTLTKGIVSSASREIEGRKYIQIDAALNKGNSGGPIISDQGQVVGVATIAAAKAENVGFAIPSDEAMAFLATAAVSFATLDAAPTAAPTTPGVPGAAAPTPPAMPAAPPTPATPPSTIQPWMWLVAAALVALIVALITSLLVAKSVARSAVVSPPMPYSAPVTPGWGPPAAPHPAPAPPPPAAPPAQEDLSDIDIELR